MVEYILQTDVQSLIEKDHWRIYESDTAIPVIPQCFDGEILGHLFWIDLPRSPEAGAAKDLAQKLQGLSYKGNHYKMVSDRMIEQLNMLGGAKRPTVLGQDYDTVTAIGELRGQPVLGVQREGIAGIVYQGVEKFLVEGEIQAIGEGPDGQIATILNRQLWVAGECMTSQGEQAFSLGDLRWGAAKQFVGDGKLTYVKVRKCDGGIEGWVVQEDKTAYLGKATGFTIYADENNLALRSVDDGRIDRWSIREKFLTERFERHGETLLRADDGGTIVIRNQVEGNYECGLAVEGSFGHNTILDRGSGGDVMRPVTSLARYPTFKLAPMQRMSRVCGLRYISGKPAYKLSVLRKGEIKETMRSGKILLHEYMLKRLPKLVAVWHTEKSKQVFSPTVLDAIDSCLGRDVGSLRKLRLAYPFDIARVKRGLKRLPVYSTKTIPRIRDIVEMNRKFAKRHLNRKERKHLENIINS
jgi:hypothetical protein